MLTFWHHCMNVQKFIFTPDTSPSATPHLVSPNYLYYHNHHPNSPHTCFIRPLAMAYFRKQEGLCEVRSGYPRALCNAVAPRLCKD